MKQLFNRLLSPSELLIIYRHEMWSKSKHILFVLTYTRWEGIATKDNVCQKLQWNISKSEKCIVSVDNLADVNCSKLHPSGAPSWLMQTVCKCSSPCVNSAHRNDGWLQRKPAPAHLVTSPWPALTAGGVSSFGNILNSAYCSNGVFGRKKTKEIIWSYPGEGWPLDGEEDSLFMLGCQKGKGVKWAKYLI